MHQRHFRLNFCAGYLSDKTLYFNNYCAQFRLWNDIIRRLNLFLPLWLSTMSNSPPNGLEGLRVSERRDITHVTPLDNLLHNSTHVLASQRFGDVVDNDKLRGYSVFPNVNKAIVLQSSLVSR